MAEKLLQSILTNTDEPTTLAVLAAACSGLTDIGQAELSALEQIVVAVGIHSPIAEDRSSAKLAALLLQVSSMATKVPKPSLIGPPQDGRYVPPNMRRSMSRW